jgi:hypothetical protein
MGIDTSVEIGYGILADAHEVSRHAVEVIRSLPREELEEWLDMDLYEEGDLDEMHPEDIEADIDDINGFLEEHLLKDFPSLFMAPYNRAYDTIDGYAIVVKGSSEYLSTTGDFALPIPPLEEDEAELQTFCGKYFPNKTVGWKQWLSCA